METCMQFLEGVIDTIYTCTQFQIIPGITIFTVLFYTLLGAAIWTSFLRRG